MKIELRMKESWTSGNTAITHTSVRATVSIGLETDGLRWLEMAKKYISISV